jgi:uncharacterized protein YutE (UPF0331/DUF86 family)
VLGRLRRIFSPARAATSFGCSSALGTGVDIELANSLQRLVGFRNIAVHDYQALQLPIVVSIITQHIDDFLFFSEAALRRGHQKDLG